MRIFPKVALFATRTVGDPEPELAAVVLDPAAGGEAPEVDELLQEAATRAMAPSPSPKIPSRANLRCSETADFLVFTRAP